MELVSLGRTEWSRTFLILSYWKWNLRNAMADAFLSGCIAHKSSSRVAHRIAVNPLNAPLEHIDRFHVLCCASFSIFWYFEAIFLAESRSAFDRRFSRSASWQGFSGKFFSRQFLPFELNFFYFSWDSFIFCWPQTISDFARTSSFVPFAHFFRSDHQI